MALGDALTRPPLTCSPSFRRLFAMEERTWFQSSAGGSSPSPMRTHVLAAMTILAVVHLPACAGHTSDARRAEISNEISSYNQASHARALSAALKARGATAMSAKSETLVV